MSERKYEDAWDLPEDQYKKLISNDQDAWQELINSKTEPLMRFIRHQYQCSMDIVEDINQEVFWAAKNSLHQLKERRSFKSWFFKIASRIASKKVKKSQETQCFPIVEGKDALASDFEPWENMQAQELRFWLARHLNILTKEQISVFALHFYEHLSTSEVADLLGKNTALVNVHLSKARARLRVALENDYP